MKLTKIKATSKTILLCTLFATLFSVSAQSQAMEDSVDLHSIQWVNSWCLGVLIAPNVAITASHCFAPGWINEQFHNYVYDTQGAMGEARIIDYAYVPGTEKLSGFENPDIVLLRLDHAPEGITPIEISKERPNISDKIEVFTSVDFEQAAYQVIAARTASGDLGEWPNKTKEIRDKDFFVAKLLSGHAVCYGSSGGANFKSTEKGLVLYGISVALSNPSSGATCTSDDNLISIPIAPYYSFIKQKINEWAN